MHVRVCVCTYNVNGGWMSVPRLFRTAMRTATATDLVRHNTAQHIGV